MSSCASEKNIKDQPASEPEAVAVDSTDTEQQTMPSQSDESTVEIFPTTEQRSDADTADVFKADTLSETEPFESHTSISESKSPTDIPISKPSNEAPPAAENPPVAQPLGIKPAVVTTNATTSPPNLPVPETEISPSIDINTYINYAINSGKEHGLIYDSSTTACWDNPIIVGSNDSAVKRDIDDLFDWYQVQGFTMFSVWAENRPDGKHDLFIGYA